MRTLTKNERLVMMAGGLMMVVGAGCYALMVAQPVMCWVYLLGALLYGGVQLRQRYEGDNFVVRRLRRMKLTANVFFILAGVLMADSAYHFLAPLFTDWYTYMAYVYNKWVIPLLVAAMLEMYSTHRMASELNKEEASDSSSGAGGKEQGASSEQGARSKGQETSC